MPCEILLPRELIELILLYCDGQTLCAAQHVNREWKDIVNYLDKKYKIWKRSCIEDIPKLELLQYTTLPTTDWHQIYENRTTWQDIQQNIRFHTKVFETQSANKEITCIAATDKYIGIGLGSGKIIVYNQDGVQLKEFTIHLGTSIKSIHFITDEDQNTSIVANYYDMLIIHKLVLETFDALNEYNYGVVDNHTAFDFYKTFFSGMSSRSPYLTIGRFTNDDLNENHTIIANVLMHDINYGYGLQLRLLTCILNENLCLVLAMNMMYIVERDDQPNAQFIVRVLMTMPELGREGFRGINHDVWVMNEDVRVSCIRALTTSDPQVMYVHTPTKDIDPTTKYFLPQEVFETVITCIRLHGNTLVIGTLKGWLYFYEINKREDWQTFDIANYSHAMEIDIAFGPVKYISVAEREQRLFYVSSSWDKIRIVTGKIK